MDGNIINATYRGTSLISTCPAWLIDYGMVLKLNGIDLPDVYEVDFANSKEETATRTLGGPNGVIIPDQYFLTEAEQIYAWYYLHTGEDNGYTRIQVTIPLFKRPDVTNVQPTPEEHSIIEQAIVALNNGVTAANESAENAAQSESNAEAWAVGERDGEPVAPTDPTYLNNAKHYANVAQQGAESVGYAFFDVNDADGNMYVTVTENLSTDISFHVNENIGELEVTLYG